MRINIHHPSPDNTGYRSARVRSMFNVDDPSFRLIADLQMEAAAWSIGLVVGPSGSGKSSIGSRIGASWQPVWPDDLPIIEAISPGASFDAVATALSSVGLGSVPPWLRPYRHLSTGERFRVDLARAICERPAEGVLVIDEFTSVVDRQVARVGAAAFSKAWRRASGQVVLLSCHYDVVEWLDPDWVFDTADGSFKWRFHRRRPRIELSIYETDWRFWSMFEPHHYLKLPRMIAATNYVGTVDGALVAHVAMSTRPGLTEARAARLVVMPEWQGMGIGIRFLSAVCAAWRRGLNRYQRPMLSLINTSHPGLAATLRRDPMWAQVSSALYGAHKARSAASIALSQAGAAGYGGHFRSVQGFRYVEGVGK